MTMSVVVGSNSKDLTKTPLSAQHVVHATSQTSHMTMVTFIFFDTLPGDGQVFVAHGARVSKHFVGGVQFTLGFTVTQVTHLLTKYNTEHESGISKY